MKRITAGFALSAMLAGAAWAQTPAAPAPASWTDSVTISGDLRLRGETINDDSKKNEALRGSVWVAPMCSGSWRHRGGIEVEAATMEIDREFVVLPVSEAAGHLFDHLDLAVEALGGGVADAVLEVREDVRQMSL